MQRKTICLNMIVKNEALVIQRCLSTVRHLIDSWVIVDTGSTDGTQELIRAELRGIPGELFERPWKNFGHNRTEARELARGHGDYLLLMDADDQLELAPGFEMPPLTRHAYENPVDYGGLLFHRINLIDNSLPWRFVGVLHEYLACDVEFTRGRVEGLRTRIVGGGARSQVEQREKFLHDAAVLEEALQAEPTNARYAFYLAQSYRDAGEPERALAAYERRAAMGGFDQEVFIAHLQAARLAAGLARPAAEVTDRYLRAYEYRPSRAEPLGELAAYLRTHGERWQLAMLFAKRAIEIPLSADALFVERAWYEWRCLDEYAIAAYWLGDYEACRGACVHLLGKPELPREQRPRVLGNLNFARAKLGLPELPAPPEPRLDPARARTQRPSAKAAAHTDAPRLELFAACPLCDSKDEAALHTITPEPELTWSSAWQGPLNWVQCKKCGHVHAQGYVRSSGQPRWEPTSASDAGDAERCRWAPAVQAVIGALGGFERMIAEDPPWAWLDVQPRGSALLATARELGFRTSALVESSDAAVRSPGTELVEGGWAALSRSSGYRAISLCDVLGRLPRPIQALRAVREALAPGGACLLTCPNREAASFPRPGEAGLYWRDPTRLHLFSASTLVDLLNALEMPVVHLDVSAALPAEVRLVARKLGSEPSA